MMCCYHPTSIVAIDDDADFLRSINQHLTLSNCILFTSPKLAINALRGQKSFDRIQSRLLKTTSSSEDANLTSETYALLVNLRSLHNEIYSSDRFKDVSVLIVDYHMGEISGIDLCEQLSQHPAKKILLTGGADKEKIAIEAFNKGIIHRFINKSDINFPTQLKQAITILKEMYFKDLTSTLIPHLPEDSTQLLQNPAYINFVRNLQNQIDAIEYYLLDASGSILFLDIAGNPGWLIVKNEAELTDYENIAIHADGSQELVQSIKTRKKIPFFFSDEYYQKSVNEWNPYLYDAHPFPGAPTFYYALIKGNIRNNLDYKRLITNADNPRINNLNIEM